MNLAIKRPEHERRQAAAHEDHERIVEVKNLNERATIVCSSDGMMTSTTHNIFDKGRRPPKSSPEDICRILGYMGIDDYLIKLKEVRRWDPSDPDQYEPTGLINTDEFTLRAFPEFPSDAPLIACQNGNRNGPSYKDMPGYITAYDITYRFHYEMQDDWLTTKSDPEIDQYMGWGYAASMDKGWPAWRSTPMDFEVFERAMLCIADDVIFQREIKQIDYDGNLFSKWISYWRRRLGRPVLAGIDDNPIWHSLVWRDSWRAVRDTLVELNRQHYPCEDDRSFIKDTRLYLSPGNSIDAALVEMVDEMARAAGWLEEPWETRGGRPGHWSKSTLGAAMAIAKQACTWADYIAEQSGRELQLSWGLYEQFANLFR